MINNHRIAYRPRFGIVKCSKFKSFLLQRSENVPKNPINEALTGEIYIYIYTILENENLIFNTEQRVI